MNNHKKDEFKKRLIADTKNFINIYETSKTAQGYVNDFEAGELVAYDESLILHSSNVVVTRSVEGQLAAATRATLNTAETTPVIMTMTDNRVWDEDNEVWQSEATLCVEVCGTSKVLTGASYWGVLVALMQWLGAA